LKINFQEKGRNKERKQNVCFHSKKYQVLLLSSRRVLKNHFQVIWGAVGFFAP